MLLLISIEFLVRISPKRTWITDSRERVNERKETNKNDLFCEKTFEFQTKAYKFKDLWISKAIYNWHFLWKKKSSWENGIIRKENFLFRWKSKN